MNTNLTSKFRVIGIMSGTSLDGLDMALVEFNKSLGSWEFSLIKALTIDYPPRLLDSLSNGIKANAAQLHRLDQDLGEFIGENVNTHFDSETIDFIASHGHTIFHQPHKGFTLQIGCGKVIHEHTGLPVIYDFRSQDVSNGGQGAPLVPIGDRHLFSEFEACLNLGGIANCSFEEKGKRVAFDLCPFNMALNPLALVLGQPYDDRGALAKEGKLIEGLLHKLNALEYYKLPNPKSLGIEDFKMFWMPLLLDKKLNPHDILHTYVHHAADVIGKTLNDALSDKGNILITGGGAFNDYFIESLKTKFKGTIVLPDKKMIDFKEAIIFAFMGVLRRLNKVNCLASVTGAQKDISSGQMVGF